MSLHSLHKSSKTLPLGTQCGILPGWQLITTPRLFVYNEDYSHLLGQPIRALLA